MLLCSCQNVVCVAMRLLWCSGLFNLFSILFCNCESYQAVSMWLFVQNELCTQFNIEKLYQISALKKMY